MFGSWTELVKLVLRKNTNQVTIEPSAGTAATDDVTYRLPADAGPATLELTTNSSTQTLTNKTVVVANNTVTTAAAGNLAATELNAALSELQSDIDTRATSSALTTHTGASTGVHGVTGAVVGTTDTQTLSGKTIDADANTITNIENADIKSGAAIDAAKIANGSVSNTEYQYLDGVTSGIQSQLNAKTDSSALTAHTGASTGVHGVTGAVVGTTDTQTLSNKTIGSPTVTGTLLLQNQSGSQPTIRLSEDPDNGTNYVELQAPAAMASNLALTLPAVDGANGAVLTTNGSGVLSFTTISTVITNWTTYTPSSTQGFGTITNSSFEYRRVGDSIELRCNFTTGTPTASECRVELPTGLTILVNTTSPIKMVGRWMHGQTNANFIKTGPVLASSGNTYLQFGFDGQIDAQNGFVARAGTFFPLATARQFGYFATVSISEWT